MSGSWTLVTVVGVQMVVAVTTQEAPPGRAPASSWLRSIQGVVAGSRAGCQAQDSSALCAATRLRSSGCWRPRCPQLDACLGASLEIEPPGRLGRAPAVHRQGHQVWAVLVVAEDHRALLAGAASDRRQAQHAEAAQCQPPQPATATREPVDGAMDDPPTGERTGAAVSRPTGDRQSAGGPCSHSLRHWRRKKGAPSRSISTWIAICSSSTTVSTRMSMALAVRSNRMMAVSRVLARSG